MGAIFFAWGSGVRPGVAPAAPRAIDLVPTVCALLGIPAPAETVSDYAPRMENIKIPADRIGFLIGPGGKNIRALQSDYGVRVSILDEEGNVQIYGVDARTGASCPAAEIPSSANSRLLSRLPRRSILSNPCASREALIRSKSAVSQNGISCCR